MAKDFKSLVKGMDTAWRTGVKRALSKAARGTRTKVKRDLRSLIGIPNEEIDKRIRVNLPNNKMANNGLFVAAVALATKFLLPLRLFKPKQKKVQTKISKTGKKTTRYGATVKIGKFSRQFVPNAFIMNTKKATIVAERKGALARPTKQSLTSVYQQTIQATTKKWSKFFRDEFDRIVNREIAGAFKQKLGKKE